MLWHKQLQRHKHLNNLNNKLSIEVNITPPHKGGVFLCLMIFIIMNLQEDINRIKEIMLIEQKSVSSSCKSKWDPLLPKAKKYMKDWVSNPTTRQKFENNWGITAAKKGMSSKLRTDRVKTAYDSIVSAVSGLGTDKTKLLNAISTLSANEFKLVLKSFSDKRTGYSNFQDMVNQEFDRYDLEDANKLKEILKNKRLQSEVGIAKNKFGETFFHDFTMYVDERIDATLEYDILGSTVDSIFDKYLKIIDNATIRYYNGDDNAYAFVNRNEPTIINVNCSLNDPTPYSSLVHEIQHLLYFTKPLNPKTKIENVFGTYVNTTSTGQKDQSSKNLRQTAQNLGVNEKYLQAFLYTDKSDPEYGCRNTEKMSNIMSIRSLFNLGPNDKITFEMIKPYLIGQKNQQDIYWLLNCWASKGFPDINQMLDRINQLAFQQTSSSGDRNLA
jgi:hypothetical protein